MNLERMDKVLLGVFGKLRADYLAEMEAVHPMDMDALHQQSTKLWVLREIRHDVEAALTEMIEE